MKMAFLLIMLGSLYSCWLYGCRLQVCMALFVIVESELRQGVTVCTVQDQGHEGHGHHR